MLGDLVVVAQGVGVRVVVGRVGAQLGLFEVVQAVPVRVRLGGGGAAGHLLAVQQPVVVGVVVQGIGGVVVDLLAVQQPVVVGVLVPRVGAQRGLLLVGQAVTVGVGIRSTDLVRVQPGRNAVAVGVAGPLHLVVDAVAVGLGVQVVGHRVAVHVPGALVGVGVAVVVAVLVQVVGVAVAVAVVGPLDDVVDAVAVAVLVDPVAVAVPVGVDLALHLVVDAVAVAVQVDEVAVAVPVDVVRALVGVVDAVPVAVVVEVVGHAVAVRVVLTLGHVVDAIVVVVEVAVVAEAVLVEVGPVALGSGRTAEDRAVVAAVPVGVGADEGVVRIEVDVVGHGVAVAVVVGQVADTVGVGVRAVVAVGRRAAGDRAVVAAVRVGVQAAEGVGRIQVDGVVHVVAVGVGIEGVAHPVGVQVGGAVVHHRVAVVVGGVADLDPAEQVARIGVVAVAVAGGLAVPVRVAQVHLHGAVVAVAVAGRPAVPVRVQAVQRRVGVVAVRLAGQVPVRVDVLLVGRQGSVAVTVHAVAGLDGAGEDRRVRVIAVVAGEEAVAVLVAGGDQQLPGVEDTPVPGDRVGDLQGPDPRPLLAVEVAQQPLGLEPAVEGGGAVGDGHGGLVVQRGDLEVVAVAADAGEQLHRGAVGRDQGQDQVAVPGVVDVQHDVEVVDGAGHHDLGLDRDGAERADDRAAAVAVDELQLLVDQAVAVVVVLVADLHGTGVVEGPAVVAVALADHPAVGVVVGLVGRQDAVAVVIQAVAALGGARVDGRVAVVTVGGVVEAVGVGVGGGDHLDVRHDVDAEQVERVTEVHQGPARVTVLQVAVQGRRASQGGVRGVREAVVHHPGPDSGVRPGGEDLDPVLVHLDRGQQIVGPRVPEGVVVVGHAHAVGPVDRDRVARVGLRVERPVHGAGRADAGPAGGQVCQVRRELRLQLRHVVVDRHVGLDRFDRPVADEDQPVLVAHVEVGGQDDLGRRRGRRHEGQRRERGREPAPGAHHDLLRRSATSSSRPSSPS